MINRMDIFIEFSINLSLFEWDLTKQLSFEA